MNALADKTNWFASWFDSPYYHLLYRNRNHEEAAAFIQRLGGFLRVSPNAYALDLACGKGRHAVQLHKLGLHVTGIDLSPESIAEAKQYEQEGLEFFEHDMRRPFRSNYYDYVFNLFTSFGYFQTTRDNQRAISGMVKSLKPEGILVIDFFNAIKVRNMLQTCHSFSQTEDQITFYIQKTIVNNRVMKKIVFEDQGQHFEFEEQVELLELADFKTYFGEALHIEHVFGNYALEPFDAEKSDRLILIARKIK
jgi:SAM-dependent methyltransferase